MKEEYDCLFFIVIVTGVITATFFVFSVYENAPAELLVEGEIESMRIESQWNRDDYYIMVNGKDYDIPKWAYYDLNIGDSVRIYIKNGDISVEAL